MNSVALPFHFYSRRRRKARCFCISRVLYRALSLPSMGGDEEKWGKKVASYPIWTLWPGCMLLSDTANGKLLWCIRQWHVHCRERERESGGEQWVEAILVSCSCGESYHWSLSRNDWSGLLTWACESWPPRPLVFRLRLCTWVSDPIPPGSRTRRAHSLVVDVVPDGAVRASNTKALSCLPPNCYKIFFFYNLYINLIYFIFKIFR